ncbi:hypothetical protein [Cellulosimicrobium protaetiae]|uniref:Uncharacterized protein n=1 Tax=Cellulosimicrobium protaetiae TaxID=2587808 RepID=A0A6M5UAP4_9MICO|nr:hypothetical protein [Cellulosimicrobium protaetiae]QJW35300.1 hypothetical protein FIC82_002875 [Cellulosimicrobium protaetiae]
MARPPVPITLDPPRGTFSACTLVPATDPETAARWVAAAFDALRWKRRASDVAHREGASLWEVGSAVRAFFLDDLDVLRLVTPRAAAFFSHGRAVATVQPDSAARRTVVTLSLVEGQLSCRESFGAVARNLHEAAVRARALPPDDVPVWTSAYDLPAGSPGDPRSRKRLFRGS